MALPPGARKVLALPGFKKYFANTSWLMVEKIFKIVVVLFVGIYVARYLGPERFGILSYAMSIVVLFSALSSLGLNTILVRELVNSPEKRDELLGTTFILKLAGSGVVLILLSIVLYFVGSDRQNNLIIFIIAAGLIFQSFNVIQFYFEAKVSARFTVAAQIVVLTVISIAKLFFIWLGLPLIYFAWAVMLESLILAIGLAVVYFKQKLNVLSWRFKFQTAVGLLKDSWPLVLSGIAISIYMKIDQVMIKQMLDSQAVGQYAAAVRLSEACYFVPVIICGSLFPAVISAKKQSKELYHARLQKLYDLMLWITLPFVLVVAFSANRIALFLYGTEFSRAGPVLAIHIWAALFVFLGVASTRHLIAENYPKISFLRTFVGMVANITLNVLLIPMYGIVGAAVATLVSYAVATFGVVFFDDTRPIFFMLLRSFLSPWQVLLFSRKNHAKCPNVHLEMGKNPARCSHKCEDTLS